MYPNAIPCEEMRAVVDDRRVSYLVCKSCTGGGTDPSRGSEESRRVGSSGSGSRGGWESVSASSRTSGSSFAKVGRYAFIATTEAPKPTFENMARRAAMGHIGEDEGSSRKRVADIEPKSAKNTSKRFLCGAWGWLGASLNPSEIQRTMICNASH